MENMHNCTYIPARKRCNKCNYICGVDEDHCRGCGASFVFGRPDAWESHPIGHYVLKEDKKGGSNGSGSSLPPGL